MAQPKRELAILRLVFINMLVLCSCSMHLPGMPADPLQGEFNLTKGTRRVYLYSEYEPAISDPTQIITAQFQLTQTVTGISRANGLILVDVLSEQKTIQMPAGLADYMPLPLTGDSWYIIKGRQGFETGDAVNPATIDTGTLPLTFDFPLSVNKSWCPFLIDLKDPTHSLKSNCDNGGKLTILQHTDYQVPAGKFEDCYQIKQCYNDGCFLEWFCTGVGVVESKYDHAGSRFGFEQVMTGYFKGTP